jgi:hypothetical protein
MATMRSHTDGTFLYTSEETIAVQVVEPVDIELTGNKLMKEFPFVGVPEDLLCEGQCIVKLVIELIDE